RNSGLLKAINGGLFIGQAFIRILFGKKRDLVWTATMPPVLQAFAVSLAGRIRGASFLYHMQDIHPEIGLVNKSAKPGIFSKMLIALDRYTLDRSKNAIVLSDDMANALLERGVSQKIPKVLRNFSLGQGNDNTRKLAGPPKSSEEVRFVFAGNIGRFQNLEALVDAFSLVQDQKVKLILVGEGRVKAALQQRVEDAKISNVEFKNHMSAEKVFDFMCDCHVGLVSLNPGLYKYAFPSKVLTYMAANLPMLAMVEDESRLAKLMTDENVGVSVNWEAGSDKLVEAILSVAEKARFGEMKPVEARHYFHPDVAKEKWVNLIAAYEQKTENISGIKQ
ncbi:MAG: glycosyltransferase family 4 protein, partial [Salaquimonas sp.]